MKKYFTTKDYEKHNAILETLKERDKIVWLAEKTPARIPVMDLLESNTDFSASTFSPILEPEAVSNIVNLPIPNNMSTISTDNILSAAKWTCEETNASGRAFMSAMVYTDGDNNKQITIATLGTIGALFVRIKGEQVSVAELNIPVQEDDTKYHKEFSYTSYQIPEQQPGVQDFLVLESNLIIKHFNPGTWKRHLQEIIKNRYFDESYVDPELTASKLCSAVAITVKKEQPTTNGTVYASLSVIELNKALIPNNILLATHAFFYEDIGFSSRMTTHLQEVYKADFQIQRSLVNFRETLQLISESKNYGFNINFPMFNIATKIYSPFDHSEDKDAALIQLMTYAQDDNPCKVYSDVKNYLESITEQVYALKETNIPGQIVSNTYLKIQNAVKFLRKSLELSADQPQYGLLSEQWLRCVGTELEAIKQRVFAPDLPDAPNPSRLTKWGTPNWTLEKLLDELEKRWGAYFLYDEKIVLMNYIIAKSKYLTNIQTITRITVNITRFIHVPITVRKNEYFSDYNLQLIRLLELFISIHPELKTNSTLQKYIISFNTQMYKNEKTFDFNLNTEITPHYDRMKKCRQQYIQLKKKSSDYKDIKTLIYAYAQTPFDAVDDAHKITQIEDKLEKFSKNLKTL